MFSSACSLHILDIRLLKIYVSVIQGQSIPDLAGEASRRRSRDILINWSRRIVRAAAFLAPSVPPDDWLLFTRLRPFFCTAETEEQAISFIDHLFRSHSLDEILNLFLNEVARLDPERAFNIILQAREDKSPGVLEYRSVDEIENALRAYLLHERREINDVLENADEADIPEIGRRIAWRACMILANNHPWWCLPTISLTALAARPALSLSTLVADPRGMFAPIAHRLPILHQHIPFSLTDSEYPHTGLCLPPQAIGPTLEKIQQWTDLIPEADDPPLPPAEVRALREAVCYAKNQNAGLWEACGMLEPDEDRFPIIQQHQADREEHPERFLPTQDTFAQIDIPFANGIPDEPPAHQPNTELDKAREFQRMMEATRPVYDDTPKLPAESAPVEPWWKRLGKRPPKNEA